MNRLIDRVLKAPKFFIWLPVALSMLMIVLALAPTLSDSAAKYLHPLTVDADPESMLNYDDPARVFNRQQKAEFSLYDLIIVGVVNRTHQNGVFNTQTLSNIHDLTTFAKGIQWQNEEGVTEGVISIDLIAPSNVDYIEQRGPGVVKFDWLMATPPQSEAEALAIRDKARNQPLLAGSLLSEDGRSVALYIPITSKGISYKVTQMLRERIATYQGSDEFFISGLPVAQDTFALEMFKQMGIAAPLAMTLIFILLWYFFRNITLVVSPMIVALVSVIVTMGIMIVTGNTIHIMSSMVPIFIMPIAVLDAIHILSEFYDTYPEFKDRKKTIRHVMTKLWKPMLFTSLTTTVGFVSLNLTPVPPIQVFGTFIGIGVLLAWFFTVTLIPAYIVLMSEQKFANFGFKQNDGPEKEQSSPLSRLLDSLGGMTFRFAKPILVTATLLTFGAAYGITRIVANDNPVKWFAESHEIRRADKALNEMFAGTYMVYLALNSKDPSPAVGDYVQRLETRLKNHSVAPLKTLSSSVVSLSRQAENERELIALLSEAAEEKMDSAPVEELDLWETAIDSLDQMGAETETFKDPQVLKYVSNLQDYLQETGLVGKSNSIVQIVKTVYRELYSGDEKQYRIPENRQAIAQTLITFQSSHRPQDLWHYVTPDYRKANLWLQLRTGDNQAMSKLEKLVESYFVENPPPRSLEHKWAGLTYINVTWQEQMVLGMAKALAGSFVIVLGMMIFLFKSVRWGVLSMIPLSFSIAVLYGIIGLVGKDYDAPIAILSALSLGLAVDYAIHFLARSRDLRKNYNNWQETTEAVFGEPARAITRNIVIVGVGFLPLVLSVLVPYQTVGVIISSILVFAGIATLTILPALIRVMEKSLFKVDSQNKSLERKKDEENIQPAVR